MSDDEYRKGFGEDAPAEEPEKTEAEIAAEEAKAEEDFISTPEDHVENPLVPDEKSEDDSEDEDRLKGAIGSGNLAVDYPEEKEETVAETPAEETPAEEAAPAEAPAEEASEPASEPVATEAAPVAEASATVADLAAAPLEPKKKSKAGLIITLVVIFLLLIGGGVAFFIWMMANESPENLLKDSLAKIWTAENVQMSGTMTTKSNGSKFEISFDGAKAGGNFGGSGKIKTEYNGISVGVDFSASYIKGGEAYFKLEGLKSLANIFGASDDDDDTSSSLTSDYSALLSSLIGAIVKKVDGQWYKISAADAKKDESTKSLGCALENLDGAVDKETMKKVAELYKKYPFITVDKDASVKEEDGVKYIPVIINKGEQKKFNKEAKDIDSFKKIAACSESEEAEDDDNEGMTEKKEDDSKTKVTLGIKPWSHELVAVKAEKEEDKSTLDVKIVYDKKDISAPSDSRNFDKLSSDIESSVKSALETYVNKMCQSYAAYGDSVVAYCKQSAMNQMGGNFDITQLFGGFLGDSDDDEIDL